MGELAFVLPVIVHVKVAKSQFSLITGSGTEILVMSHTPDKSSGHSMTGASLSTTVTVKEQTAVFPAASDTLKVLVVVPTGNAEPGGKPAVCVVVAPGQLSVPTGGE